MLNGCVLNKNNSGSQDSADSSTATALPSIGANGDWYLGDLDTGIVAQGKDGTSVSIQTVNEETIGGLTYTVVVFTDGTTIKIPHGINGQNGNDGKDGIDGFTPYVQNGVWYINGVSTGVRAEADSPSFRLNGTMIQWRKNDSSEWLDLFDSTILKGNNGTDGKSAFELYVQYCGYSGTEEEWVKDLISGKLYYKDPGVIDHVNDYFLQVGVGEKIGLPTALKANYTSGANAEVAVEWNVSEVSSQYIGQKVLTGFVEGYTGTVHCTIRVVSYRTTDRYIDGFVNGGLGHDNFKVTALSGSNLYTTIPGSDGYYRFDGVPFGDYTVKLDADGYETVDVQTATITAIGTQESNLYKNIAHVNFDVTSVREDGYYFLWRRTESGGDYETSAAVNSPIKVSFLSGTESAYVSNAGAASLLREKYGLVLTDEGDVHWSSESASRFYDLYTLLPESLTTGVSSTWKLVSGHLDNDINFVLSGGYYHVSLSVDALANITPRLATIDGKKGQYFSKRCYNAIIRFITNNGADTAKCETLLNTNFLCSFAVPDYAVLTADTTKEDGSAFSEFAPEEKLLILTMFEEMPVGMHKIKELKYLVRRKTGLSHPLYPSAAAVTWPTAKTPYIEFFDKTFGAAQGYYETKRLIIHDKMHMYYAYYFSDTLKKEWEKIGGWSLNGNVWSTTKSTEFVTAYAHEHNPDEDMAETVATYVLDPELLRSRSSAKYEFVRNYIMEGEIYLSTIRSDLTFEVYNLAPDYLYPGKIDTILIKESGSPFENKSATITLSLHDDGTFSGAKSYYLRLLSPSTKQFVDVSGAAVDSKGLTLRGTATLSRYSESGYWFTNQIVLADGAGNERYEGPNDYALRLFLDNPLEDLEKPTFVAKSLALSLSNAGETEHPDAQKLTITFTLKDNIGILRALVRLACTIGGKDSLDQYAENISSETGKCTVIFYIPDFYSSGTYEVVEIVATDFAGNTVFFNSTSYEKTLAGETYQIAITTTHPDNVGPSLNLNAISVTAIPLNQMAPDGETTVTLKLKIKDDISGVKIGYVRFVDPQGIQHGYWLYFPNTLMGSIRYFEGDPTLEAEYTFSLTLPKGSAPGIWGVYEISLTDYSLSRSVYSFSEITHFTVS
jgi:hypothetical protein